MSQAGRNFTQKLVEVKEDNSSASELFDFVLVEDLSLPSQPRPVQSPFLDTDSEVCSEYGTTDSLASPASLPFDFDITDSETLTTTTDLSPQISNFLDDIHICGSPDMPTTTSPLSQSMAIQTLGSASMATLVSSTHAPQSLLGLGSSAPSTTFYQQPFQFQQTQSFPQYNHWTSTPLIQPFQSSFGHSWGAATNPEPSDVASFFSMNPFSSAYPPTLAAGTQSPVLEGLSDSTLSVALSSYYPLRQPPLADNNAIALTTPCTDPAPPAATVSRGSNPVVLSMSASSSPSCSPSSAAWHSFTSPVPIPATVPATFTSFSSSLSSSSSSSSSSSLTVMKAKGKTVRTQVSKSVPRSGTALSNNRKALYKCDICSLELTRPSNLKVHREIHTGTRDHCCGICQHSFRLVADLARHMRIHSGEKPYPCPICTNGESFSRVDALRRHFDNQHKGDSRVPTKKMRRACGQKKPFKEEEEDS